MTQQAVCVRSHFVTEEALRKLEVEQSYALSKHAPSDIFPPARLHVLIVP